MEGLEIGFWNIPGDSHYGNHPSPIPCKDSLWLSELKRPFVERILLLQKKAKGRCYKGWSECRLCGKMNGSKEYYFKDLIWPSGYLHYIQEHDVRPPENHWRKVLEYTQEDIPLTTAESEQFLSRI